MSSKKVLIIGPDFFGYNDAIAQAFLSLGYQAEVLNITDKKTLKSFFIKSNEVNNYLKTCKQKFELILIIKGTFLNRELLNLLKLKTSKLFLWLMDDFKRFECELLPILSVFDHVFTFQSKDLPAISCQNDACSYLPLCATPVGNKASKTVDISFVGSLYGGRDFNLNLFFSKIKKGNHIVYGGFDLFRIFKMLDCYFKYKFLRQYLKYGVLKYEKYINLLLKSKVVINIHSDLQTGLNMRAFECYHSSTPQVIIGKNLDKIDFGPTSIYVESIDEAIKAADYLLDNQHVFINKLKEEHSFTCRVSSIIELL